MKILLALLGLSLMVETLSFEATSKSFEKGEKIKKKYVFNDFGCPGNNLSPHLKWKNPPKGVKSYAVTMFDPDAPTDSGWWHWTMFNIPTKVTELREGASADIASLPSTVKQGRVDYGFSRYGGPCPPKGDKEHRYLLTVYALDVETLDLNDQSSGALVSFYLNKHTIEKASVVGVYGRK